MYRALSVVLLALLTTPLLAQQESMYTQYMFNKLLINPGYAGSRAVTSVTMLYRDQWTGFNGAPRTGTFSVHGHLRNPKVALGLTVLNDRIGLQNQTGVYANYAYRLPLGEGRLSFGVQGGFDHYQIALSSAVHIDAGDPTLGADLNLYTPNIGAGVYYQSEVFYAGVSALRLVENDLSGRTIVSESDAYARQARHLNAMMGGVVDLTESVKFRPAVLVKYAPNAPVQADFNASFLFLERLWAGMSYRTNASLDFMVEFQISRQLRVGYAYDHQINAIGPYTTGSHEVLVGFDMDFGRSRVVTPRMMAPRYF
jgi:type IX secretion system PorP/SprF family membrane protein